MKGIIYCAYNLKNHKRYIGQTIKPLQTRINLHYYSSSCSLFHKALMKYAKDDWVWSIIDIGEAGEELSQKEQYWISFYDTYNNRDKGYNLTKGGEGSLGVVISEEHKQKTRNTLLQTKINNYIPKTTTISKPVRCIETDETFSSISEAAKAYGVSNEIIRKAASDINKMAGGYHWEFLTGIDKLKALKNALYCVELDKFYESFKQARKEDRFHEGNLRLAMIKGDPYEVKHYAGYSFYWVNPAQHIVEFPDHTTTK